MLPYHQARAFGTARRSELDVVAPWTSTYGGLSLSIFQKTHPSIKSCIAREHVLEPQQSLRVLLVGCTPFREQTTKEAQLETALKAARHGALCPSSPSSILLRRCWSVSACPWRTVGED